MSELAQEILKLGTAGLICLVLLWCLYKSEQREAKKDARIQLLENQLIESYDERIVAAGQIAEAMTSTRNAVEALTIEIRARALR
ncbi:hypothetical protein [Bradyrhizobium yuanmingense]|uniref:hypothetical protein n=1 Tax=Bradyrhizobium yuanmingense TaxID=108015 RepID=UPI0004B87706|nr:hypothetical protein [Bradyrhizobium yuanmingense]